MNIFRKIKSLYSKKEWSSEFAYILNRIDIEDKNDIYSRVIPIYIEENMIDEIFSLLKNCCDFNTIKTFEKYLTCKYKNEIINLYINAIENEAQRISSRAHYRDLAYQLKYLKGVSKEKADILIKELITKYKNRPAMLDEFKKLNIY